MKKVKNIEYINSLEYYKKHGNNWVAIDSGSGKVISFDKSLKRLISRLKKYAEAYILEKVIPPNAVFAPIGVEHG